MELTKGLNFKKMGTTILIIVALIWLAVSIYDESKTYKDEN